MASEPVIRPGGGEAFEPELSSAVVERAEISRISLPIDPPMISGAHYISSIDCNVVEISSGDQTGVGYTFAFSPLEADAVTPLARHLGAPLRGMSLEELREFSAGMWDRINFVGRAGVGVMALSAIDVALWDLNARCLGLSVTELLGGEPRTVELYGAGGWLSFSDEELVEEALKYRDAGFTAYKMRAGADWRADVERAGLVREAIGDEMDLMVDANQAWSVETAIEAASALAGLRLGWLEEPVDFEDFEGMARVRDTASMPIAAGETVYGPPPFRAMIAAGSVDVLQPDLMRCGGISGFLEVVEAARGTGIVVCPHLFSETSYQLVPVAGAGGRVEYLPSWFDHLFAGVPDRSGGSIAPAGTPGLGIAVSGECRERWEVSRQSI